MRLAALALALIVAGCGTTAATTSAPDSEPGWTTYRGAAAAITVRFPSDWHLARRRLTPALLDPAEVLTLATSRLRRTRPRRCAHVPEQAVRDIGPRDVLLSILERRDPAGIAVAAPHLGPPVRTEHVECAGRRAPLEEHWTTFRRHGRGFHLYVAFGTRVAVARRRQVDRILATLRIRPPVRAGDLRVTPPDGWAVVRQPLTGFRELAVASYRVPSGSEDRNCTPRRAIDALPADGALLYVLQADAAEPGGRPTGASVLRRPAREYECFGRSRRASWSEHGRAVQAQLYLGRRASAERRRELARVFDSLVVRQ